MDLHAGTPGLVNCDMGRTTDIGGQSTIWVRLCFQFLHFGALKAELPFRGSQEGVSGVHVTPPRSLSGPFPCKMPNFSFVETL